MLLHVYLLIFLPILAGIIAYFLPNKIGSIVITIYQFFQLGLCFYYFLFYRALDTRIPLGHWMAPVGIEIHLDSISLALVFATCILFLFFNLFNLFDKISDRYFNMYYMILQGLLIGIFLVDDLFSVFVLVEVSTMVVSLLIMHKKDSRSIYDGLIYLLINTFSMTFFLFGIAILYKQLGTFSMYTIKNAMQHVVNKQALYLPYTFIITSVCLKSAIMPLFSWLPKAHGTPSAPSTVSAVLSGLYVKGGIYLYIRMADMFSIIDTSAFFFGCGALTAIIGFVFAMSQSDIKMILSYSTISQLGLILLSLNMGNEYAQIGATYHIINHAFFKSALFLCAGYIVDEYKTRDIYKIKGVFKRMPIVSFSCIFAILGITGAPLFNGSISKYFIAYGSESVAYQWLLIFINFGTTLTFVKFSSVFIGESDTRSEITITKKLVLFAFAIICLLGGAFGTKFIEILFGVSKTISNSYIDKSIIYLITVFVAIIVYLTGVTKSKPFKRIKNLDFSFNDIVVSIPLFFCVLLVYMVFKL